MIHSMSGGVIAENGAMRFAKVETDGAARWYLAPFYVEAGERVVVLAEGQEEIGVVIRTELCSPQTAPIPARRAAAILKKAD